MLSGTTCVLTIFNWDMILCANSGDSRAILISEHETENQYDSRNSDNKYYYTQLSNDHKPDLPQEAQRIIAKNGRIEPSRITPDMMYGGGFGKRGKMAQPQFFGPKRVWLKNKQLPGLAMTRSIGDLVAGSVGVTSEPELQVFSNLTE